MTHTADPLVGRTVAHYEIQSRLGGGGMGVVYKAHDRKLGRPVALKFLPPQWSHDEHARERFMREAQAASATHHPAICTIHDVAAADDGQLFIVMAYYAGQTLKRRLEGGPLPVDDALEIATQVADGLARAHAQGVVHRDIKPGNLILTEDGVRIVDFGLATFADALQITAAGETLGTAAYMSPEQVRGQAVDARTDVWALGVVLYEMLAGHPPFRGTHPEALGHAIRTEVPPPLRGIRPEVAEDVEQIVFRALHKDPAVRFASGREMARALRQARGVTVPLELRTQTVDVPPGRDPLRHAGAASRRRLAWGGAAVLAVAGTVAAWAAWPPARQPIIIAPVSNATGFAALDQRQRALTHLATLELADARHVRALPYERLLPVLRRYPRDGRVVPTADVLQAVRGAAAGALVVVPVLDYDDGLWRARAELRDPVTGPLDDDPILTSPVRAAIPDDAAAQLVVALARAIDDRFASPRSRLRGWIARLIDRDGEPSSIVAGADAAMAFEEGTDWYDAGEYHRARAAFDRAAAADPRSPLPLAWASRAAIMMGQGDAAADAGARAERLLSDRTREPVRLFVEGAAAEARRDVETAASRYGELARRYGDEPLWTLELAAFHDRRGDNRAALAGYEAVRQRDVHLLRAHVDLCRVNNRLDERANARDHATRALDGYRAAGDPAGELQAQLCRIEALRTRADWRPEARTVAAAAVAQAEAHDYAYALARAHNYVALVASADGQQRVAIEAWRQAADGARELGNRALLALVAMNLGVAHEEIGRAGAALDFYRESYELYQRAGDESRAAEIQANIGMLQIEYGIDPDAGLRTLENALGIFRDRGNSTFEIFGAQIRADYWRYIGRPQDALRELSRARNLAAERGFDGEVAISLIALAQAHADLGEYAVARDHLLAALADASPRERSHAHLRLARIEARLGDAAAAATHLADAGRDITARGDEGLLPLFRLVSAELAFEAGDVRPAREHLAAASALWIDDLPDEASVLARGYLGLLSEGDAAAGRALAWACVERSRRMRRLALEARCLAFAAYHTARGGRPAEALRMLDEMPPDAPDRQLPPEARSELHAARAEALTRMGRRDEAERERTRAQGIVLDVRDRLPERYRDRFTSRVQRRPLLGPAIP